MLRKRAFIALAVMLLLTGNAILALGERDPTHPLGADPTRQWNTFMGGSSNDENNDIALDGSGNVRIAGSSYTTWGVPVDGYVGGQDAFVAALDSDGARQWHTFMGSAGNDDGNSVAVDGSGNVYVAGVSDATWGSPLNAYAGGGGDAFVAKLNDEGVLQWLTFLGGTAFDSGSGLALDESHNVYVIGTSVATWGAPVDPFPGGTQAPFVAKLDSNGDLQWNTFWGSGSFGEFGRSIAADGGGNLYAAGDCSGDWGSPVAPYAGSFEACVLKLDTHGARQWNTFLGSAGADSGLGIAIDASGGVYVAGYSSDSWGAQVRPHGGDSHSDPFVVRLNGSDGARQWNTFMGSANIDYGRDIAVDPLGNLYVAGDIKDAAGIVSSAFLARLDSGGFQEWEISIGSTYYHDFSDGVVADAYGHVYVVGESAHSWGAPIDPYVGWSDAFAARFDIPAQVDVAITKSARPSVIAAGEAITYALAFSNRGYLTATGVLITDTALDALTQLGYTGDTALITPTGSLSFTWQVRDLPPGAGGVITITGIVSPGLSLGTVFTNTATITSATVDGYPDNNSSSVRVVIQTRIFLPLLLKAF